MPIQRRNITDEVYDILFERITSRYYKKGELLPSQEKLAKDIGVSRNTIREAVNRLATVGFLTSKQGFGTVIKSNNANSPILQTFEEIKHAKKIDAADIIVVRYTVERSIVRLAALNIKRQEIKDLRDNLNKQKKALDDDDINRFTELDINFHLLLADASGSGILRSMEEVNLEWYRDIIPEILHSKHKYVSYHSHEKIFQAILDRDPTMADETMKEHVLKVIKDFPENPRLIKVKKALAIEDKK